MIQIWQKRIWNKRNSVSSVQEVSCLGNTPILNFSTTEQLAYCHFRFFICVSGIFEKAINYFRTSAPELKEERAMLLEEWLNMEASFGELGDVSIVQSKLPKKLKKRRQMVLEDGPAGYVA